MMNRFLLPSLIFLLFIFEGTVMQVVTPDRFGSEYIMIPRFAFLVVIVSTIFFGRAIGTSYGIFLGIFQDVVYTHVLGVYIFSMGLVAYLLGFSYKIFQKSLIVLMVTAVFGTILLDYLVYSINMMVGITDLGHQQFFQERFLPSLIINTVFMILFAYPLRKLFIFLQNRDDVEEKINERKKEFKWQR